MTELPVTLPIDTVLLHTARAVVHLTGALVYTCGLAFQVTAALADSNPAQSATLAPTVGLMGQQDRQLMLGVEYPDGRSAHNYGPRGGRAGRRDANEVRLSATSGDYYGQRATLHCFLSPLPPTGELIFAVAWPAWGLIEHTTAVAVGDIAAAAKRVTAVAFLPAPAASATPHTPATMPIGGWFDQHLGLTDEHC